MWDNKTKGYLINVYWVTIGKYICITVIAMNHTASTRYLIDSKYNYNIAIMHAFCITTSEA